MTLVRLIKNWTRPDLMRQTPGGQGEWAGIRFTEEPAAACDYAVVLNFVPEPVTVACPPGHVWALMQEPPVHTFADLHRAGAVFSRVYTTDARLQGRRYVQSQPALPWHVNRSYDELRAMPVPEKPRRLSWITSSAAQLAGHRARLAFLDRLRSEVEFDLYGRGFHYIEDKWDGLAPYRYSIAVENFRSPTYWTEKIADCFLSWTLPIYSGCTRIDDYFPPESVVQIDLDDPDAVERVREVAESDLWRERLDAIAEARELVLNRYQLFPFLAAEIRAQEARAGAGRMQPVEVEITNRRGLADEVVVSGRRLWRKARYGVPGKLRALAAQRSERDRRG